MRPFAYAGAFFAFTVVVAVIAWPGGRPPAPAVFAPPAPPEGRSVEAAYQAIPHRRTVFDAAQATGSDAEREYLRKLFVLTDLATAARVHALLDSGGRSHYDDYIAKVLDQLAGLRPPERLKPVHTYVTGAIRDQQEFFRDGTSGDIRAHSAVRSASQNLHKAYATLMSRFGRDDPNAQAFFDHLCALDFI